MPSGPGGPGENDLTTFHSLRHSPKRQILNERFFEFADRYRPTCFDLGHAFHIIETCQDCTAPRGSGFDDQRQGGVPPAGMASTSVRAFSTLASARLVNARTRRIVSAAPNPQAATNCSQCLRCR